MRRFSLHILHSVGAARSCASFLFISFEAGLKKDSVSVDQSIRQHSGGLLFSLAGWGVVQVFVDHLGG